MYFFIGLTVFGVFGSFTYYLPELFPTRLRGTGAGFCYNVGRIIAAGGPFLVGTIAARGANALASALHVLFFVGFVPLVGVLLALSPSAVETKGRELASSRSSGRSKLAVAHLRPPDRRRPRSGRCPECPGRVQLIRPPMAVASRPIFGAADIGSTRPAAHVRARGRLPRLPAIDRDEDRQRPGLEDPPSKERATRASSGLQPTEVTINISRPGRRRRPHRQLDPQASRARPPGRCPWTNALQRATPRVRVDDERRETPFVDPAALATTGRPKRHGHRARQSSWCSTRAGPSLREEPVGRGADLLGRLGDVERCRQPADAKRAHTSGLAHGKSVTVKRGKPA